MFGEVSNAIEGCGESEDQYKRTPCSILTGFLGSGKTTLVNHILKNKDGLKIAVIENEFGEVGVDDAIVLETEEEVFEMNNGCVCCTVRGDLLRILHKLVHLWKLVNSAAPSYLPLPSFGVIR